MPLSRAGDGYCYLIEESLGTIRALVLNFNLTVVLDYTNLIEVFVSGKNEIPLSLGSFFKVGWCFTYSRIRENVSF